MNGAQLNMQTGVSEIQEKKRGISGSTVKIIAVLAMLIDHAAATVLVRQLFANGLLQISGAGIAEQQRWLLDNAVLYFGYSIMRGIGRLGFPIFCFLLVEGFQRTRDVKKYALRLGLFALISEIPFDLAIGGRLPLWGYQNVYFTLLLGLLALCAYSFFAKYEQPGAEKDLPGVVRMVLTVTAVLTPAAVTVCIKNLYGFRTESRMWIFFGVLYAVMAIGLVLYGKKRGLRSVQTACADMTALGLLMILAEILCTDYSGMGVFTITVMYLFRKRKVLSMLTGCIVLIIMSVSEVPALFALIPIALYNGKRGLKMKYFFYAFYPAHLLLLYILAVLLGLGSILLL